MKTQKKIGWQKYEEAIKEQINSSFLREILDNIKNQNLIMGTELDNQEYEYDNTETEQSMDDKFLISIPESIVNEASMITSFDCWIAHTNFNITEEVKNKVNKIEGVEILKVHSRYRFFIGIGKMFDFASVRQDIEKAIL